MEITEVRVFIRNEDKLKAYVTVTFDDVFVVRNLKVIQGERGLFVSMPSRKMSDGTYRDICHPVNNDMRNKLENRIVEAYNEEAKKPQAVRTKEEQPPVPAARTKEEQPPVQAAVPRKPGEFDSGIH